MKRTMGWTLMVSEMSASASSTWTMLVINHASPQFVDMRACAPRTSAADSLSGSRRLRRNRADTRSRRLQHRQNKCRRDEAERAGDEEGRQISRIFRTYHAGAKRGTGGADLVAGKHPTEHHARLLRAQAGGRQVHRPL